VAFVDDPGDPSVESALAGKHYAFIPVAVSATVVAFLAAQNLQGQIAYPLSVYNLTPNMVAGLITSAYQSASGSPVEVDGQEVPGDSDNLIPPLKCEYLKGCPNNQGLQVYNELPYNTFSLLNPAATGVNPPAVFGSFMSNISNGSSYGVTKWICAAPNMPISVTVDEKTTKKGKYKERTVSLTDPNVADHTLTTAPGSTIWPPYVTPTQPNGPPWVFPTCQGYSTFPALASGDTDYSESQNPSFQAKSIRSYAYSGNELPVISPTPLAGFGVMDSSEADYNGLNSASLQNADGNFVSPTPQSIDAALANASPCAAGQSDCPAGTYAINYSSASSADAYSIPDITYAVVSTKPQEAGQATAIKNLLTNLVTYSHSSVLPAGYAPLPDGLYQAALGEISQDIVAKPGSSKKPPTTVGSSGGSPHTHSGGSGGVTGTSSSSTNSGDGNNSGSGNGSPDQSSLPASKGAGGKSKHGGSSPGSGLGSTLTPSAVTLLALDELSSHLLLIMLILAAVCLVAGPLLYFLPEYRRRRRAAGETG
jgi:hypothetical protein